MRYGVVVPPEVPPVVEVEAVLRPIRPPATPPTTNPPAPAAPAPIRNCRRDTPVSSDTASPSCPTRPANRCHAGALGGHTPRPAVRVLSSTRVGFGHFVKQFDSVLRG